MNLKRFYKEFLAKYKFVYFGIFLLSLIQMAFVMITPSIQSKLVNMASGNINISKFITLVVALIISLVGTYTFDFFQQFLISKNSEQLGSDIRKKLNNKCNSIEMKYYDNSTFSDLISKFQKEVMIVQEIGANLFIDLIANILKFIIVIIIMLRMNVQITIIVGISLIFYGVASKYLGNIIKKNTENNLQYNEELIESANETFDNSLCIKLNGLAKYANDRFDKKNNNYARSNIKLEFIYLLSRNIGVYTILIGLIFIWIIGGIGIASFKMNIGDVLALISYQSILFTPIGFFSEFNNIYNSSISAIDNLYKFFDENDEKTEGIAIKEIEKINLRNVGFGYNKKLVLKDINISLEKGNVYALIGKSGCGKTTLIKLLTAIYRYNKGEINVNDKILSEIDLQCLRNEIAISLQENLFFNDSLINNLRFDSNISDKKIYEVGEKLDLLEDIEKLSDGWNTILGRNASRLSTGQAKRLDLLRIFLKKSSVIILDEPTSCLDNKRKQKFYEYLDTIKKDKIIILITHNLEEIKNANYVYLLKNGKLKDMSYKHNIDYVEIYE